MLLALLPGLSFAASPYAGEEQRAIKALSAQEVQGLLEGKGLGFAKAAELNHYPGPAHVLELATRLELSAEQEIQTRTLFGAMQQDARRLGQKLFGQERALDRESASGTMTPEKLRTQSIDIGATQAELRRVHLQAHLDQRRILTDQQIRRDVMLRGYGAGDAGHGHEGHSH